MTERVRRAIAEAGIKLMEKIHNGDAAGVAAMYTEDAVILPPNMEKVSGRMAIEEFWAIGISQLGLKFSELRTEELLGSVISLSQSTVTLLQPNPLDRNPSRTRARWSLFGNKLLRAGECIGICGTAICHHHNDTKMYA